MKPKSSRAGRSSKTDRPLVVKFPHVVHTQRDSRRLRCKVCRGSERILGNEEMPPKTAVRSQFDWVVRYNAAVERFLSEHEHKEVP